MSTVDNSARRPAGRGSAAGRSDGVGPGGGPPPILAVTALDVHYGQAHALQSVSLAFDHGVLAVVGRNGMGKTTLCNAITGLTPAVGRVAGSIRVAGRDVIGLAPHRITGIGVGYVPQGRRVWPSLTVDEHLRLAAGRRPKGPWDVERIYQTFPRLAERRRNGGSQLSGGEQQMLAISRALLFNPRLLVMDEPTEGLAPVIVQQVASMLKQLAADGEIAVLLVEQNLGVAIDVADRIAVMVNGRIAREMAAAELATDLDLQQRLLGVRAGHDHGPPTVSGQAAAPMPTSGPSPANVDPGASTGAATATSGRARGGSEPSSSRIFTVRRAGDASSPGSGDGSSGASGSAGAAAGTRAVRTINRWNATDVTAEVGGDRALQPRSPVVPRDDLVARRAQSPAAAPAPSAADVATRQRGREARVVELPVGATIGRAAYVAGTFDTKARELFYLRNCLEKLGLRTVTVDLSTSGKPSPAMVHPREVARRHPRGERAVFTDDRGSAVSEMAEAFAAWIETRRDLGGLISAGGSGGTALATAAMRRLPIGVPKLMVSTVASGDVRPYVGPTDICMMYSVTDVSGINRISEQVLANAAHALAGMISHRGSADRAGAIEPRPALGLTMFGVTTPCVQAVARALEARFDCLTFHATGTGGQSLEKLVDSGLLTAALDITPTEICDELVGGVLSAGPDRLGAFTRHPVPWVGSCGALDMVNFWAMDTVPAAFRGRKLYRHNPNVTLMRTTAEECRRIGAFLADRINRMPGPVRFLIPEAGVSSLDAPGLPFHDPEADRALFDTIAAGFRSTPTHRLQRLPLHLNDPAFADALVAALDEVLDTTGRPATVTPIGAARSDRPGARTG